MTPGRISTRLAAALSVAAVLAVGACDRGPSESERLVERSYAAYRAVADALAEPDCAAAVARAQREVDARRADLAAGFALQADPDRLAAARPALEAHRGDYAAIDAALEAGFGRCAGTPGLDRVQDALEP